jgi:cytochrome c oxidase assembly factor CtaG
VHVVDPGEQGNYPTCPWLALTGTWCPGCGSMRAVAALTHPDVAGAAQMNVLMLAAVPLAVAGWAVWLTNSLRPAGRRRAVPGLRRRGVWLLLAALVAFAVVRNTPFGIALAPGGIPAAQFLG